MKKLVAVLLLFILASALTSCVKGKETLLFTGDADFVLTLKRDDGDGTLIMDVTRRDGVTEASVTFPSELSGVKFSRSGGNSVIKSDSVSVPLTEDASLGANIVFDILADPVPESAVAEKSEEGAAWIFDRDGASVILRIDDDGVPLDAEIVFNGMKRTVEIDSFVKK